jgi:hypothetical protein
MATERERAIRERAYAIWEDEGHPHGKDLAHWVRAEAEMRVFNPPNIPPAMQQAIDLFLRRTAEAIIDPF